MKEHLIHAAQIIGMGILLMSGIRLAEWAIPEPESRVVICFANELDQVEICRSIKEILDRAETRKSKQKGGA